MSAGGNGQPHPVANVDLESLYAERDQMIREAFEALGIAIRDANVPYDVATKPAAASPED